MPKFLLQLALGRCHFVWLFFLNLLFYFTGVEGGRVSCIPGWPWTCYVAENDLKLSRSPATSQGLRLQVCPYPWFLWHWGSNIQDVVHVSKCCTIWGTSPALGLLFEPGASCSYGGQPRALVWGTKAKKPLDARRQVHTALVMVYLSSLPISSFHVLWPGETVTLPGFWGLCCAGQYLENHRSGHLPFVCMPREL